MRIKIDPFIIYIIIVILIAYFFPFWGSEESTIPLDQIGSIGIALIFFFYGLKLSPEKLKAGLSNWKLHLLVQSTTFLIFPLMTLAFYPFISMEQNTLWLAFMFLAALPSTVSSSVVMVSIANGNVASAIFNASISGLIGIIVTPLWMGLFLENQGTDYNLGSIYTQLLTGILLPVALGLLLQRFLGKYATQYSRYLTMFDKSVILLIIYKSFAESFYNNLFQTVSVLDLLIIGLLVTMLFYAVFCITGYISKWLKFSKEDQITAQFCGSKKSLVHGTVFSKILFNNFNAVGIVLLPLMLFHALQIFIVSVIATQLAKRKMHNEPT